MEHSITIPRLNGVLVTLRAYITLDGAIQYWKSVDPETGAHVELPSADKWHAVRQLHRAVMARGAA